MIYRRARNEVETKKLFVVDGPKADYSLKEGESININIPNVKISDSFHSVIFS